MKRLAALVLLALVGSAATFAQREIHTTAEIAFIKIKNPDGSTSVVRGGTFPVVVKEIQAKNPKSLNFYDRFNIPKPTNGFGDPQPMMPSTVYLCDSGTYYVADQSPSVLDDLSLTSAANGQAWKIITFGVHLTTPVRTGKFLVRYRGFESYVPGLGPGIMAFQDEFMDFGFYLMRSDFSSSNSTFLVTGDLTLNPIAVVPNQTCFLAQQFREPQLPVENGEGQFTDVWNVFSVGPQIGSSEDLFWYDSPPDGIYDETEPDNFGEDAPGAGNFAFKVVINSGSTTTVNPFSYSWVRGVYQSGNIASLWFNDQNYNVAKAGFVLFPGEPPAQLQVESFSPTMTPTAMRLDVDAKVNTPGLAMKIEFWNFTTSTWQQVASGPIGTSDSTMIGFSANPAQCVQAGTGTIRAKVSFYRTGLTLVFPWTASVDQVIWTIGTS